MEAHPQSPAPETLLVAVNARFSHTNLAVRYLKNALEGAGIPAAFREYTINQPVEEILADLYRSGARRFLFSCYIWNRAYICRLGEQLRLIDPDYVLLAGGPEVSFDPEERLAAMPWADAILCGEGEPQIAGVLREGRPRGVRRAGRFTDLDALPFPYRDFDALKDRVLYYESSRGCPFGCSYCLSSADRTVRYRSLPRVFDDLRRFLDATKVHLAVSLHNPFHEERAEIMPVERAWPVTEVAAILREYDFTHQRRVSFEYIVMSGLNDSPRHIRELTRLLNGIKCRINLIRFHKIPDSPYFSPDDAAMIRFRDALTARGIQTTIRASRGEDIQAACGLLSTRLRAGF